jgi:hypothetical protein
MKNNAAMEDHWTNNPRFTKAEKQEPVAYIRKDQLQKAAHAPFLCEVTPEPRQDRVGIYTNPQPKREWVGLTTDEVFELASTRLPLGLFAKLVEAKLREKNT